MTENKENTLGSNISSQGNSVGEFIFSYPIKTEADFFQFRAWCNRNKIFGVERELTALEDVKISANMMDFLQKFYTDQGSLNEFDQKALLEFIRKRQKSGRGKKATNSENDERPTTTEIAAQLIQSGIFRTFRDNESVYYYRDGVYVRNGETKIKEMVHEILEGEESSQFCSEVIGKIQRATYTDR